MSVFGVAANVLSSSILPIFDHRARSAGPRANASTLAAAAGTPLKRAAGSLPSAAAASTPTSSSTTDVGSTFLNLLVKELQNQDPTAPMDSTAMVGQMISLNQLDQLISINQAISPTSTSTSPTGYAVNAAAGTGDTGSAAALAARSALLAGTSPGSAASALLSDSTLSAAAAAASNASTLNLTNFNTMFGAK